MSFFKMNNSLILYIKKIKETSMSKTFNNDTDEPNIIEIGIKENNIKK